MIASSARGAHEFIGSLGNGYGPLCVFSDGQAGDAKGCGFKPFKLIKKIVDHEMVYKVELVSVLAFFYKIGHALFFCYEKQIGYGIGDHSIDFFGHGKVKASQTGLNMGHFDLHFLCHD